MGLQKVLSRNYGCVKNREDFEFRLLSRSNDDQQVMDIITWFLEKARVHPFMRISKDKAREVARWHVDKFAYNSLSVGAFHKETGKLAAIGIQEKRRFGDKRVSPDCPEDFDGKEPLQKCLEEEYYELKRGENGFYMDCLIGAVYPQYASIGLASEAACMAVAIATEVGCVEIVTFVSHAYAMHMYKKMGYKISGSRKVQEFVDPESGKRPFVEFNEKHENYFFATKSLNFRKGEAINKLPE